MNILHQVLHNITPHSGNRPD